MGVAALSSFDLAF